MHVVEDKSRLLLEGTLADLPCRLEFSGEKGRFLVSRRVIQCDEEIFQSHPYLTTILPSWKKRICRGCFAAHSSRLSEKCQCNQAWYCSEACRESHASSGTAGSPCPVPHTLVCPVLSHFGASKCDADMESVLHMCLDVLALQHLEAQALSAGAQRRAKLGHADFLLLQDHSGDFSARDRQDWVKALTFLEGALRKAAWPGPCPGPQELIHIVGRIAANNFGIYRTRGGKVAAGRQGVAAQHASASAEQAAEHAAEPQSSAVSSDAAQEPTSRIGLARLPAWPLAQPIAAQASPDQAQTPPYPPETHASAHLQTAGSIEDDTAAEACESDPRQPRQQHSEEDSCGAQVKELRISEDPSTYASQGTRPHGSAVPGLAEDVSYPNTGSSAGRSGHGSAEGALCQTELRQSACGVAQPDSLAADGGLPSAEQTADMEPDRGNSRAASAASSTAHNLRERATASEELIGRELYIRASLLNHSCRPNCVVVRGMTSGAIVAQRDIEEGEELTISYIDLDLPPSARCDELRNNFFFECTCDRCNKERTEGATKCTYERSKVKGQSCAPKRRGRKARVSR